MDFRTSNLVCAATLLIFESQLQNIEVEPGTRRGTFVLTHVKQEDLDDFKCGNLLVEPLEFNDMVRFLNTSVTTLIKKRENDLL